MAAALFALTFLGGTVASFFSRWPVVALGVYVLTFYAHPPSRWWGSMLPDLRWALSGAAVALLVAWRYKSTAPSAQTPWYRDSIMAVKLC
jgi:hypothetical protein